MRLAHPPEASAGAATPRHPIAALALLFTLGGCGLPPPVVTLSCAASEQPPISLSPDGETASTTLSVLTYNIEGLPPPARNGRVAALREIGERLSTLREQGKGPDIVLFQEMFSNNAKRAVTATGYPAITHGPRRIADRGGSTTEPLPGKPQIKHGEIGLRFLGSGLAVASRYPIIQVRRHAYGRKSCAGFDCLANKGIVLARIAIPGLPTPIDIYDTHMNSKGASHAPATRHLVAHERQTLEASDFINKTHDDAFPLIFGGDFNMRHSEDRWDNFSRYQALLLVHSFCADPASVCDVRMSWDGDEPWMDTQDLQFFWRGDDVLVRPLRVEAMFDGGASGPLLSDHDGFLVTYKLSWKKDLPALPGAC